MLRNAPLLALALLATPAFAGESSIVDPSVDKAPTVTTYTPTGLGSMNYPGTGYTLVQTALYGYHALDWKGVADPDIVTHNPPHYSINVNGVENVPQAGTWGVHCHHADDLNYMENNPSFFGPFLYENAAGDPEPGSGEWLCPETPSPIETIAIAILGMDRWGSPTYFDYIIPTATGATEVAMIESVTISTPPGAPTLTQACHVQGGNAHQLFDDFVACAQTVPWTVDSLTLRLWTYNAVNGQHTWTQSMTPAAFLAGYQNTQNELTQLGYSTTLQHVVDPEDEDVTSDDIVALGAALSGALHARAEDGSIVSLAELPASDVPMGMPAEEVEAGEIEGPGF
ncbi:MAG: hypothetical protein AAF799_27185 [Myxococcota bacterium]